MLFFLMWELKTISLLVNMKVEIGWYWLAFTFKEQLVLSYIKMSYQDAHVHFGSPNIVDRGECLSQVHVGSLKSCTHDFE